MMNKEAQRAINLFKRSNPELTVTTVLDYDDRYFVVEAMRDPNKKSMDGTLYSVEKRTGATAAFSPVMDLKKFREASMHRMIFSSKYRLPNS